VDRGDEVMSGGHVGDRLVKQIAALAIFLEVMVSIDDRNFWVDHLLGERALPLARLGEGAVVVAPERRRRGRRIIAFEAIEQIRLPSEECVALHRVRTALLLRGDA